MYMEFDLTKVEFSPHDRKKGLRLPSKLTPELAEDVGFHIGDGYMKYTPIKSNYQFSYSGGLDDENYFKNILIPRKLKLFNIKNAKMRFSNQSNSIIFCFYSKAVLEFYRDVLKVEVSPKNTVSIPKWIFTSDKFKIAFVRGLVDSDGSLRFSKTGKKYGHYPIINFCSISKKLLIDVKFILHQLGFKPVLFKCSEIDKRTQRLNIRYYIQLSGVSQLEKWIKIVGFNNTKHFSKYMFWKKFHFYDPNKLKKLKWAEQESNLQLSRCKRVDTNNP